MIGRPTEISPTTLPRLVAGSIGAPEASFRRSSATSSATAATAPSTLSRARAGGDFGSVSGTSNTPLLTVSLRPDSSSTTPRPTLTTTLRPLIRVVRSASLIAGNPSTGRTVALTMSTSTDRPSSGIGGPPSFSVGIGALAASSTRVDVAALDILEHPVAHLGGDEHRPDALGETTFHRRADHAAGQDAARRTRSPYGRTWRD